MPIGEELHDILLEVHGHHKKPQLSRSDRVQGVIQEDTCSSPKDSLVLLIT